MDVNFNSNVHREAPADMSDLDRFFKEEQEHMNMTDEEDTDYLARVLRQRVSQRGMISTHHNTSRTSMVQPIPSESPVFNVVTASPNEPSDGVHTVGQHGRASSTSHSGRFRQEDKALAVSNRKRKSPTGSAESAAEGVLKRRRLSREPVPPTPAMLPAASPQTAESPSTVGRLSNQRDCDASANINVLGTLTHGHTDGLPPRHTNVAPAGSVPLHDSLAKDSCAMLPQESEKKRTAPSTSGKRDHLDCHTPPPSGIQPEIGLLSGDTSANKEGPLDSERARSAGHAIAPKTSRRSRVAKLSAANPSSAECELRSSVTTPSASTSRPNMAPPSKVNVSDAASKPTAGQRVTQKEKPRKKQRELVTPLEYAQRLHAKLSETAATRKSRASPYLRGKRIYYYGADMLYASEATRGRMDYIIKHGGTVIPTYDPALVTHIVTSDRPQKRPLLRVLGLRSLEEIPDHIPTVKWSWVVAGYRRVSSAAAQKGKEKASEESTAAGDKTGQVADGSFQAGMDLNLMFHAAFKERIDAGINFGVNKARSKHSPLKNAATPIGHVPQAPAAETLIQGEDSGEVSAISEFTVEKIQPKESLIYGADETSSLVLDHTSKSVTLEAVRPAKSLHSHTVPNMPSSAEDPLGPFYEQARAEQEAEHMRSGVNSDEDEDGANGKDTGPGPSRPTGARRGFLCDLKGDDRKGACANQDVVDKLRELQELHRAKLSVEDNWRVYSYGKAIRALQSYPTRIRSYDEARAIRGVGDKTAQKITEIMETGDLRRIGYEKTEEVEVINIFQGIYGVGRHTAFKWWASGCRTLDDIRARKGGIKLSTCQEIGLKYYADINSRMPRSEAADIFDIIKSIALFIDPQLFIEITGSYRRGKADCGDIDILITRPTSDGKTHRGVLRRLLGELHRQGIIAEDLSLPETFDDLELVYRGLCRRDASSARRRIDFLTVPYESRGAALLYYTGDDIFNRSLRLKANKMGYSLNQRGLFQGVVRNPSNRLQKLNDGNIVASETEEEILRILGVPWQEPHERVRG